MTRFCSREREQGRTSGHHADYGHHRDRRPRPHPACPGISQQGQFWMVDATRRLPVMAAIPGPTALAFACLGTAVALHGLGGCGPGR